MDILLLEHQLNKLNTQKINKKVCCDQKNSVVNCVLISIHFIKIDFVNSFTNYYAIIYLNKPMFLLI